MLKRVLAVLAVLMLANCGETVTGGPDQRILLMGDSMMAFNRSSGNSVADAVEEELGEQVVDRSVSGARYFYLLPISGSAGLKIEKQYRPGPWSWIILNGGGNDLWFGCGCNKCQVDMSLMIAPDGGMGSIPSEVARLRRTGARVIYVGYLRSPGVGSIIEHCKDDGDEFERRLQAMAARDDGIYFVPVGDMVPYGDRSYHSFDMIHPSAKGSAEIARRISVVIKGAPAEG